MKKRVTETALILPALYLMSVHEGSITTSTLIQQLRGLLQPTGKDLELLSGRSDDKFSQKVRNLKAHNTLERSGYARYHIDGKSGYFELTDFGESHLGKHETTVMYLLTNDFLYKDLIETFCKVEISGDTRMLEAFDEDVHMQSKLKSLLYPNLYERSQQLRAYAVNFFKERGELRCQSCDIDYADVYGTTHAFIEMHHVKPILKYADEAMEKTLKEAVHHLTPLCANCHRLVHDTLRRPLADGSYPSLRIHAYP